MRSIEVSGDFPVVDRQQAEDFLRMFLDMCATSGVTRFTVRFYGRQQTEEKVEERHRMNELASSADW